MSKLTISPGEAAVKTAEVSGKHATMRATVIGSSCVVSILSIACVVAIAVDAKHERDYVSMILPVITGVLSFGGGFFAGHRPQKD